MFSVERKKRERILCFVISIGLVVLMQVTEVNVEDKRLFAPPLNQMQFLYSLLKEDYEEKQIVPYEYLNKPYETLDEKSLKALKSVIQYMNPNYQQEEDLYSIDFTAVEDDRLKECFTQFAETLDCEYFYMPYNWKWVYSSYKTKSPFFVIKEKTGNGLVEGMISSINYAINHGYKKTILGIDATQLFTDEEKAFVSEKYEELMQLDQSVSVNLRLEKCKAVYKEIDSLLGGNTNFKEGVITWMEESKYEEAWELYNKMYKEDVICSSYARRITDYMGIMAGILPVLLAVFLLSQGNIRREELVYVKGISSCRFVINEAAGLFALYSVIFLIVYLVNASVYSGFDCCESKEEAFAIFVCYYLCWLLPTLLIAICLPMFIYELFGKEIVAALISMIIMIVSMSLTFKDFSVLQPIIRFNAFGYTEEYRKIYFDIVINRISVTVCSVVLLIGTIALHNYRRTHISR